MIKIATFDKTALVFLAVTCCLLTESSRSEKFEAKYRGSDIYQVFNMDAFSLGDSIEGNPYSRFYAPMYENRTAIGELDRFLNSRTSSINPEENLNLILEQLILDQKDQIPLESESNQVKRLVLALRTLTGENECNYYSFKILFRNTQAMRADEESIVTGSNLRRIDMILAHFINRHVKDCRGVYFKKFDEITKNFDPESKRKVDTIFKATIEKAASDEYPENVGKSQAERFYNAATYKLKGVYASNPEIMYNALRDLSADNPDARFLRPVKNEKTGSPIIRADKFNEIFSEYIRRPCQHFRNHYGPDVFVPYAFDDRYKTEVQKDRPDFYEAWFKYELCMELFDEQKKSIFEYASKLPI